MSLRSSRGIVASEVELIRLCAWGSGAKNELKPELTIFGQSRITRVAPNEMTVNRGERYGSQTKQIHNCIDFAIRADGRAANHPLTVWICELPYKRAGRANCLNRSTACDVRSIVRSDGNRAGRIAALENPFHAAIGSKRVQVSINILEVDRAIRPDCRPKPHVISVNFELPLDASVRLWRRDIKSGLLALTSSSSLLLEPALVTTCTGTVAIRAASGTYATTSVSDHRLTGAGTPSINTWLPASIAPKFAPKIRSRPARPSVQAEMLSIRGERACGEEKLAPGATAARQIITKTRNDLSEFFIAHHL